MCSDRRPARRAAAVRPTFALLLLAAACATLACGKQGEPRPPLRQVPQSTDQLSATQRGYELLLELPYPKTTTAGMALPPLDRVEVWSVVRPVPERLLEAAPGSAGESGDEAADEAAAATPAEGGGEGDAAAGEAADEGATGDGEDAAQRARREAARRRRELARPLDGPQFAAGAELRRVLAGADLEAAVAGDRLLLHVTLPEPLPTPPEIHYLAVRTAVGDDVSAYSNQVVLVPRTPPPPPGRFAVEQKGDGIEVSWQVEADPEVVGYNLYRRDARSRAFGGPVARPPRDRSSFFDRTVTVGETYIYSVTSVVSYQPLIESAIVEVREVDYRDRFPPPVPGSAVALAEDGRVRVVWEGSDADDLAGYLVSRRHGEGEFAALFAEPRAATEYVDEAVEAGETYVYRVVAVDASGNRSEPAEASTEAR